MLISMNKKLKYYFIFCLSVGTLIYFLQLNQYSLPAIINNYVNDFLIIPIVLFLSLVVLRWSRNNKNFTLSLPTILYVCFFYSFLFEFIFPKYLTRYTKDFVDVIVYFASGFLFYYLQKQKNDSF